MFSNFVVFYPSVKFAKKTVVKNIIYQENSYCLQEKLLFTINSPKFKIHYNIAKHRVRGPHHQGQRGCGSVFLTGAVF